MYEVTCAYLIYVRIVLKNNTVFKEECNFIQKSCSFVCLNYMISTIIYEC